MPYLYKNKKAKNRLLVVVSSSMGMCGAYNMNIKKLLESEYKKDDEILIIGNTLYNELKNENLKINADFVDILNNLDVSNVRILSKFLLKS